MKRFTSKKFLPFITPRLFAACGLLALLAAPAFAVTRAVPSAFPTIQAAVNAALPGDRIVVAPGVYQEHVVSTNSDLKFIGKNTVWDGTLTNGTAGVCLTATGDNLVVQGFIFRAGASSVAQVQITGTNARVARCSSRGPSARFLRVVGNGAVVDTCTLYSVNSTAIEIIGDGAVVRKVKARQCDDNVIRVVGARATVTDCLMSLNEDSASISISGTNAVVARNTFLDCDGTITISGTGAVVEKNKLLGSGNFFVTGDSIVIRGNTVTGAGDDSTGISVSSATPAGGGVIENNKLKNISQTGFVLSCHNVIVRGNSVTGAGTESGEHAWNISGSGNRLTNNLALGGGTHGFNVTGASNLLVKCTAIDAAADGFNISNTGNTLLNCIALICTGEGLDNGGTGTTVTGCSFKKNRLDVGNNGTFSNLGTFAVANTFVTGGPAQLPQVD